MYIVCLPIRPSPIIYLFCYSPPPCSPTTLLIPLVPLPVPLLPRPLVPPARKGRRCRTESPPRGLYFRTSNFLHCVVIENMRFELFPGVVLLYCSFTLTKRIALTVHFILSYFRFVSDMQFASHPHYGTVLTAVVAREGTHFDCLIARHLIGGMVKK